MTCRITVGAGARIAAARWRVHALASGFAVDNVVA
jgi:hypothetical protein